MKKKIALPMHEELLLHWEFLEKVSLTGCNCLFMLVLEIGRDSWKRHFWPHNKLRLATASAIFKMLNSYVGPKYVKMKVPLCPLQTSLVSKWQRQLSATPSILCSKRHSSWAWKNCYFAGKWLHELCGVDKSKNIICRQTFQGWCYTQNE